jgi:tRNA(Ile)-lysidine synthase
MEIVGAEAELAREAALFWRGKNISENQSGAGGRKSGTAKNDFASLPTAVQRKILQQQLIELGVAADFELVEELRELPEKFVSVGLAFSVARDLAGRINLRRSSPAEFKLDEVKVKLTGRMGRMAFGGRKFHWHVHPQKHPLHPPKSLKPSGIEMFDADRIGGEIILRHWRAGDRFQPIGMGSPVKLQDLFVNAKIPVSRRRSLVLATTAGGEIFWVEELRIGEQFKLTAVTRRKWVWERIENEQI